MEGYGRTPVLFAPLRRIGQPEVETVVLNDTTPPKTQSQKPVPYTGGAWWGCDSTEESKELTVAGELNTVGVG